MRKHSENIAILSENDARNPRSWSGTPYYVLQELTSRFASIQHLGPMPSWPKTVMKVGARIQSALDGRRGLPGHANPVSQWYGRIARQRLDHISPPPDVIFSPAGSVLLAKFETSLPIVYSSDATVRIMLDYYPQFTGLSARAIRSAEAQEQAAISRADLLLYPTSWAADSAISDYGADPAKVRVISYGANLSEVPEAPENPAPAEMGPCRLLMVGVDWTIKGGAIAVQTLQTLQGRGIPAELTVVGCTPPAPLDVPGLTFIPFLDKNSAADRQRLDRLYRDASFFILPSRCECFGIVFCEAAAYGLPAMASHTGGIPEVVREGENGYTIALSDDGTTYAERIAEIWSDPARYQALRQSSRQRFETELNWNSWGAEASQAIHDTVRAHTAAPS